MVAYQFEDSCGGKCPAQHLAGFAGLLQIDGYGAYTRLADPLRAGGPVTLATLLTTAKLNNADPHAWLKLTLERIAGGWSNRALDALMPWNYHSV